MIKKTISRYQPKLTVRSKPIKITTYTIPGADLRLYLMVPTKKGDFVVRCRYSDEAIDKDENTVRSDHYLIKINNNFVSRCRKYSPLRGKVHQ